MFSLYNGRDSFNVSWSASVNALSAISSLYYILISVSSKMWCFEVGGCSTCAIFHIHNRRSALAFSVRVVFEAEKH